MAASVTPSARILVYRNQSSLEEMEAKHSSETLKHLEKQNECLIDSYRAMSHELHRLQVEEQMLMRKLYEVMSAEGLLGKEKNMKQPSRENAAGNVESSKES
ncbi:hypothetical protein FCM35_KLT20423 [Carex littledalei]|uniref:Uncharacterized protein n=1 Tax=Carex littledalei TaxID=544730 RepID=A0A833RH93_9POAL|nr:hypothetical protein FCM35_KLT20423 [Carex littledalei]